MVIHTLFMVLTVKCLPSMMLTIELHYLIIDFSWISNNSSHYRSIRHKLYWKPTNYVLSQLCNYNSSSFQEGSCTWAFRQVHILNHQIVFYDFYNSPHTDERNVSTRHIERWGLIISPPNIFTTRVMSTIITHATHIQLDKCAWIFHHHMMLANGEK